MFRPNTKYLHPPIIIRSFLLSWLIAVTIEYFISPGSLYDLSTIAAMQLIRVIALTFILTALFLWCNTRFACSGLRWSFPEVIFILSAVSLSLSYTPAFLFGCIILFFITLYYALRGWNSDPLPCSYNQHEPRVYAWIVAVIAIAFFISPLI